MKRRDFFRNSSLSLMGASLLASQQSLGGIDTATKGKGKVAKNIIFLVSDGMSTGTLNMANVLLERKEGRKSTWVQLYLDGKGKRALMDTASANGIVTDSAASSSSWGGGVRVNNGSLNVNPDGSFNKPILHKFKAAGKSVGCVTSVPITHATPAGFCINHSDRNQDEIAVKYLPIKFDVMFGGGMDYFSASKRKDKEDVAGRFKKEGYHLIGTKDELLKSPLPGGQPILGIFADSALPYALDHQSSPELIAKVPTLAEMTRQALTHLSKNKKGFAVQIEGGKVDWAAHSNDTAALIYDQIAFDEAIKVALDFAEKDQETLVIITTDHGNGNPGLFGGNEGFDRIQQFKHSNEWVLQGINHNSTTTQIIERIEAGQGYAIKREEALQLRKYYEELASDELYNSGKLPMKNFAVLQAAYTGVSWASTGHSADYVELAAFGPGSEMVKPFVKNIELHNLMLTAAGVAV